MSLISLNEVSLRYGANVLLSGASLFVQENDRLAIIGRNGCGKSSLLKIIAGLNPPDSGLVERSKGLKTAYMPQEVPTNLKGTVYENIASGLGESGAMLAKYHQLLPQIEAAHDEETQNKFDEIVHKLNELDAWDLERKIAETIDRLKLSPSVLVETLSAGLKRRVLLGKELAQDPDILILDEPTNHLDIDSVLWLEKFLKDSQKTLIFVSHDRTFLQNLSTRVAEVDRGRIISFDCDFKTFVNRREDLLRAEEQNNAIFDKKLAEEEAWLRQGVKARRTRNEGRVKELLKLRKIRSARRSRNGNVNLQVQEAENSGQKVMDVKNLCVSYSGKAIIKDFSTTIFAGDKIGIIGRNGVGKTTLLNALLGKIKIDSGEVNFGTRLQIVYFDQLRRTLDPKMRLFDFLGEGSDFVRINGQNQNIMGYLQNFLFEPEQIMGEIAMLSGGEKNRLLLAKLFTNPANVMVLDEPTNDLDIETLDILESALVDFKGTILLVSHDRSFLNNIVTGLFCFEDNGNIIELVGGYDDWESYKEKQAKLEAIYNPALEKIKKNPAPKREKFTNKEREELEKLPQKIAEIEKEIGNLSAKLQDVDFIIKSPNEIPSIQARISELEKEDEILFERWSQLEERKNNLE